MATKIQAPSKGYNGRTEFGPLVLDFTDGIAVTEDKLTDGHKAYFKERGYVVSTVRAEKPEPPKEPAKTAEDPKQSTEQEKAGDDK